MNRTVGQVSNTRSPEYGAATTFGQLVTWPLVA